VRAWQLGRLPMLPIFVPLSPGLLLTHTGDHAALPAGRAARRAPPACSSHQPSCWNGYLRLHDLHFLSSPPEMSALQPLQVYRKLLRSAGAGEEHAHRCCCGGRNSAGPGCGPEPTRAPNSPPPCSL
jgi:hypothetical protein